MGWINAYRILFGKYKTKKYYLGEGDKVERITLKWSLGKYCIRV
jgi:hypothetical protein